MGTGLNEGGYWNGERGSFEFKRERRCWTWGRGTLLNLRGKWLNGGRCWTGDMVERRTWLNGGRCWTWWWRTLLNLRGTFLNGGRYWTGERGRLLDLRTGYFIERKTLLNGRRYWTGDVIERETLLNGGHCWTEDVIERGTLLKERRCWTGGKGTLLNWVRGILLNRRRCRS